MMHVIREARAEANSQLRLRFADGRTGRVDLRELVAKGGVFASLRNDATFAKVRVGESGRWIEWPGDIDLCADALYQEMQAEHN